MDILSQLRSLGYSQSKRSVASAGFLESLQETCGLSTIGLAELKALDALERTLISTPDAHYLPFTLAAFLLDESGIKKGIAAGFLHAPESWTTIARIRNTDQHWPPNRHPQVPQNILRALLIAEQVRSFWLIEDDWSLLKTRFVGW
jgi:hypothetical protein